MNNRVAIIGAGLAGCEAALTLASFGKQVILYEQKPLKKPEVYHFSTCAELVCNNSLSPQDVSSPLGLLTHELSILQSTLITIASVCRVDDTHYFAIDKQRFSREVTQRLESCAEIKMSNEEITDIPEAESVIIASGPLTNEKLLNSISKRYGIKGFHYSDASSSVVDINSIDLTDERITKLSDDLFAVRIPDSILARFSSILAQFYFESPRRDNSLFQECQSIEMIASQGTDILNQKRLTHPGLGSNCLLLRRENGMEDGFILVGSMTTLRHEQQREAFSILPGFSKVRFLKYGRMHQNTFFESPGFLNQFYQIIGTNTYIVGQLSGIDGYAPAISSGHIAALHIQFQDKLSPPPKDTMIGGLANYVSNIHLTDFQPMCASYSLIFGGSDQAKNNAARQSINKYHESIIQLQAAASR